MLVPFHYLNEPQRSLPQLVWAAHALTLNASQVSVSVLPQGSPAEWPKPFLAWDVSNSVIDSLRGTSVPNAAADAFAALGNGLSARVAMVNGEASMFMQVHGRGLGENPVYARLRHGSVAMVDERGRMVEWDDSGLTREAHLDELRQPWVVRNIGWWLPAVLVLGFVGMLVVASLIRRGKR